MARKYPTFFKEVLNFDTLGTELVEEIPEDRAARLRREREVRRGEILRQFRRAAPAARVEALSKAFRLGYAGKPFPIHFDVLFTKEGVSATERYTLTEAAFSQHLFQHGRVVGNISAIKIRPNRPRVVPPHFTHPALIP